MKTFLNNSIRTLFSELIEFLMSLLGTQKEAGMSKYVRLGHGSNAIRYDLLSLESAMKTGGQGNVYFPDKKICIKVLHNPDNFTDQLSNISKIFVSPDRPYEKVRSVSAVPMDLIWEEKNDKVIGYAMEQFSDWHSLNEILTEYDSESIGMDLKSAGLLLAELCKAVRLIHNEGFVIGDFNPSNVLFKLEPGKIRVKLIDVDSWSIYRKNDLGIEYASRVLDKAIIYYPDVIQADRNGKPWPNFTPEHDWWAFACISWMVLTKYDPFMTGMISNADREDRILGKHTANSAATVQLHPECGPVAQALGPKLRLYLDRCLKNIVKRPFPTMLLYEFANDLRSCSKCRFTAHSSAVICPRCAQLL